MLVSLVAVRGVIAAGPGDADTVRAAIEAMNAFYNETTGLWDTGPWWHSGVALRAVAEYMLVTGSEEYVDMAAYTVDTQRAPLNWWPEGGGDFRADSTDDTGWWALALASLYQATGNSTYLDFAKEDEAYMYDYWNTTTCGGGLIWNIPSMTYHNAISNELYLELTATLHNLIPGDTYYLNQALKEWAWFNATGSKLSLEPFSPGNSRLRRQNLQVRATSVSREHAELLNPAPISPERVITNSSEL